MAMDKIAALAEGEEQVAAYDEKLAHEVLKVVNDHFPKQLTMVQLKHELNPEPSDETLLLALDALLVQKLIEGPHMRSGFQNDLHHMALVRITAAGRDYLQRDSQPNKPQVQYGDQYINLGHVGSVGPNSTGTVNVGNTVWQQIKSEVDLNILANELGRLRIALQQSSTTREDAKQIGIVAEAEEAAESGDGGKTISLLSKATKGVWEVAERIGTDIAAKVIVEASKG
jgi:hypothetical protein